MKLAPYGTLVAALAPQGPSVQDIGAFKCPIFEYGGASRARCRLECSGGFSFGVNSLRCGLGIAYLTAGCNMKGRRFVQTTPEGLYK